MKYFRLGKSFITNFWVLFRLNVGSESNHKTPFKKNFLTENFGFIINASFHATLAIVLCNMLTAMMTKSYVKISVRKCFKKLENFS
jgi:hypothetical protein